jgi:hypothetical protein
MSTVTITEEPLALEELLAIVDGAGVELADGARDAIAASRAVVDLALARNDVVYGLTTSLGRLRAADDHPAANDLVRAAPPVPSRSSVPRTQTTSRAGHFGHAAAGPRRRGPSHRRAAERPQNDVALGLLEDMLATAPSKHVLGAGTDAALHLVEEVIKAADPQPDAVHRAPRERLPVRRVGASVANGQSAAR